MKSGHRNYRINHYFRQIIHIIMNISVLVQLKVQEESLNQLLNFKMQ